MKQHSYSLRLLMIIIFFLGCGEVSQNQNSSDVLLEDTPETLSDRGGSYGFSEFTDFKSRGYSNLVDDLYNEAKEKDDNLSAFLKSLEKAAEQKSEIINKFEEYHSQNTKYFGEADQYILQIQDSTKRTKVKRIFKGLQSDYQQENKAIQNAILTLERKEKELKDQEVIMKLMISAKMMKSYQSNEKVDLKDFKDAIDEYQELIRKTDEFIQ